MANKKSIVKKYHIALNEQQWDALGKLMIEDMQTNVSAYFGFLIAEVTKMREGVKSKRPVGRPKKEEEEELWYPCPYGDQYPPYRMQDLEAYYGSRKEVVPPQPAPYTKEQLTKWEM